MKRISWKLFLNQYSLLTTSHTSSQMHTDERCPPSPSPQKKITCFKSLLFLKPIKMTIWIKIVLQRTLNMHFPNLVQCHLSSWQLLLFSHMMISIRSHKVTRPDLIVWQPPRTTVVRCSPMSINGGGEWPHKEISKHFWKECWKEVMSPKRRGTCQKVLYETFF